MQNITESEKFKEEILPNKYSININDQKTEPNKNKKISKIEDNIFIEEKEENSIKKNLMYEKKKISPLKLYFHLSGKFEIFLMILGTIGSLGSGVAGPLMTYLFGDTFNDFTGVTEEQMAAATPEQLNMMLDLFNHNIDDMIKNYVIYRNRNVFCYVSYKIYVELCWFITNESFKRKIFCSYIKTRTRMV